MPTPTVPTGPGSCADFSIWSCSGAEAQQTERRTTGLLGQIPGLTRKVNDGTLSTEDLALMEHLAMGLLDIFDSLPELRSMAVTTNAFRADFVRRKFDVLIRELAGTGDA